MAFNPIKCLKLRALEDNCTISLAPSLVDGSNYYFSKNGSDWYADEITLNNGEYAYVKGTKYPSTNWNSNKFTITGEYKIVSGNIMSLVDDGAGKQINISQTGGFQSLFSDTKLKSIPANLLPARELDGSCYAAMFAGCSELTEIPAGLLPATELATLCYSSMFSRCSSLKSIPANLLPSTTLAERCYISMFKGCTSLTTIPVGLLPAYRLTKVGCYEYMFQNCTNLTTVPEGAFMAKKLEENEVCYLMFDGCSALNEIHVEFTEWPRDSSFYDWVDGVADNGDFYCPPDLSEARGTDRIPENWTIHKEVILEKCLKFRALQDDCTISLDTSKVDGSHYYFSKDGTNWVTDEITLNNGECAYVLGTNYPSITSNCRKFNTTGQCEIVSGNIMSLVDGGAGEQTNIDQEYGFCMLFYQSKLTAIPADLLPATDLAVSCYELMFYECTSLTTIPANLLPAMTLAESCYKKMFYKCSTLTAIPADLLPAADLAADCYFQMFYNCGELTEIPVGLLPATELAEDCYTQMFANCAKLTTVPKGAFMAKTFPDFQACYRMFQDCSALNEIHVGFTEWPTGDNEALFQWVLRVSETGDFYCPTELPDIRGTSRIPEGWNLHRENPFVNIKELMIFNGDSYIGIN